jgi:hypothetical protein
MWINMVSAFTRNDTYAAIRTGRYNNLYTFVQGDYNNGADARDAWIVPAADGGDCRHSPNPTPAGGITWCPILPIVLQPSPNTNQKGSYSAADFVPAACLLMGVSLTDMIVAAGQEPPPIGLLANPQGGTTIEAWLPLEVASGCVNATCLCNWPNPGWTNCPIYQPLNASCANGGSYHGKSQSLFNITVSAVLWVSGDHKRARAQGLPRQTLLPCTICALQLSYPSVRAHRKLSYPSVRAHRTRHQTVSRSVRPSSSINDHAHLLTAAPRSLANLRRFLLPSPNCDRGKQYDV